MRESLIVILSPFGLASLREVSCCGNALQCQVEPYIFETMHQIPPYTLTRILLGRSLRIIGSHQSSLGDVNKKTRLKTGFFRSWPRE